MINLGVQIFNSTKLSLKLLDSKNCEELEFKDCSFWFFDGTYNGFFKKECGANCGQV